MHSSANDSGPARPRGSCFGFEVHSTLEFSYLRQGSGSALSVEERDLAMDGAGEGRPLQSWEAIPGKRVETHLYRNRDSFDVRIGSEHRFRIHPGSGPGVPTPSRLYMTPTGSPQEREILLWTTPAAIAITLRRELALHASSVDVGHGAVLLTGPSGAGKTTTAAAFHMAGYRVLADDLTCCRLLGGPALLPGPAVLRLRHDTADRLVQEPGQAGNRGAKMRLAVPADRRGDSTPVPLRAIVFLAAGDRPLDVRSVSPVEALRMLWPASFYLPTEEERGQCFQLLGELVGAVPSWQVTRALDWEGLPAVVDHIANRLVE